MSYINHLHQNNLGQNIVHSQLIKFARVLVSFIVIAIFAIMGWLVTRYEKLMFSGSMAIIAEGLVAIGILAILIWKSAEIIETACYQRDKAINALKENEAKLKSFLDTNLIGVVEVNADGCIDAANDEFLRITGYNHSAWQNGNLNWFKITPLEYSDIDKQKFSQAKVSGCCTSYDKELICVSGHRVKVSCTYTTNKAQPDKYIINFSESKNIELEKNLSVRQHWLENLLNIMPAPLLLIEPGTAKVIFANKAVNEMAGGNFPLAQSQEDYSKLYRFTDESGKLLTPELIPLIRVAMGERLEGVEINWYQGDKNYSIRVFADTLNSVHEYPATCMVLLQDVTQLKQLETSLSLGQNRLELLFETTSDLISSEQPEELIELLYNEIVEQLNLDCYLYYLADQNSQKIQLANYSGITCLQAKDLECFEFGQGICSTITNESSPIKIENVQQSDDPNLESIRNLGLDAYYSCPLIAQEQFLGIISFGSRNIAKFTSDEINLMQAVCNQIAIAIQRANLINSLQQANRVKDEFLGILSHELRSPLNSILGWAQYLRVRKLDESTTSRALESIERNSRELHHLIEELLDMSRTIQGKMQLSIRNCNLAAVIIAVIENLSSASVAKQIEIKLSVHKGFGMDEYISHTTLTNSFESLNQFSSLNTIPASYADLLENQNFLVAGDNERLRQVMWNLLSNAIKFTSCGGCVEVSLLEEKTSETSLSYAVIRVSDTGIGINSEFIPRVFDRFSQCDSSNTRAYNGLGLGLAIVRHIVELHGGSIFVESPGIGKGSTFTVKLPLITPTEPPSAKKNFKSQFVTIN